MQSKFRLLLVLGAGLTLFIVIITASIVFAQASPVEVTNQIMSPDLASNSAFDTDFTSVITNYLPILLKDFTPCVTIPTLISPANGDDINTLIPLFSWNNGHDPNATESVIQLAEDYDFKVDSWSTYSYYLPGVYEIQFPWNLKPGTTYYWRAWLNCKNIRGPYSEIWSFTTSSTGTILPAPQLISPANGSTVPSTHVTLKWSLVPEAIGYGVYWIKLGQPVTYIMQVSSTQAIIDLASNSTYQWWVRAINDYALGDESETRQFNTPVGQSSNSSQGRNQGFIRIDGDTRLIFEAQENANR